MTVTAVQAQEWAAFAIVGAVAAYWARRIFLGVLAKPLAELCLRRGWVKWAFRLRNWAR